eukprot:m51a1_g880 hypothetical protein (79) ;mRNA; r:885962-886275
MDQQHSHNLQQRPQACERDDTCELRRSRSRTSHQNQHVMLSTLPAPAVAALNAAGARLIMLPFRHRTPQELGVAVSSC